MHDTDSIRRLLAQQVRWRRALIILWLMVLLVILAWGLQPTWWNSLGVGDGTPRTVTPRGQLAEDEQSTIALFKAAAPGVVYITTSTRTVDPLRRLALDMPRGSGTGFIWDAAGHIVTNFHVIQDADAAVAYFGDHQGVSVSLVGVSPDHDLAVLRLDRPVTLLEPIPIGSSQDLLVGQKVFAIGNPFGLDQTLTTGVISALNRSIEGPGKLPIQDAIQTDAAINPGNSGGPLLDSAGRLIGVNTAIYSPSGASAGIGFAIPIDTVNLVVPRLIADGIYSPPKLGVVILDERLGQRFLDEQQLKGVIIREVIPGTVAEAAGLRGLLVDGRRTSHLGDVLLAIDGKPVTNQRELVATLGTVDPSQPVVLRIWREGQELELEARFPPPVPGKNH